MVKSERAIWRGVHPSVWGGVWGASLAALSPPPPLSLNLLPYLHLETPKEEHLSLPSLVLTLRENLRALSVDLVSLRKGFVLHSREIESSRVCSWESEEHLFPFLSFSKLGAHLIEGLETLVCAFEVAYLVALGGGCDCGFLITLWWLLSPRRLVIYWLVREFGDCVRPQSKFSWGVIVPSPAERQRQL
jgi:hypothetical protein